MQCFIILASTGTEKYTINFTLRKILTKSMERECWSMAQGQGAYL